MVLATQRFACFEKYEQVFRILDDSRMSTEEAAGRVAAAEKLFAADIAASAPLGTGELRARLLQLDIPYLEHLADDLKAFLHDRIAERISGAQERYEGKLEGCLTPLIKLDYGASDVQTLAEIYYRLIKNHPFLDGNKKIATAFLMDVVAASGGPQGTLPVEELANTAVYVAQSEAREHEQVQQRLSQLFSGYLNLARGGN